MNSTQKIWMNAHNKKKRYGSRSRRKNYRNNAVFGDSAVPSLHDVTLKMHKVIDHADNALLSFKPINYNRIHKRWRNKKYKIVSGGVNGAAAAETIVNPQSVTIIEAVAASGEAENGADTTVVGSSADSKGGDECLESRESRTFSGRLVNNDTIRISEKGVGTYDAFIQELAALNNDAANEVEGQDLPKVPPPAEKAPAQVATPVPPPAQAAASAAKLTVAPAKNKPDLGANSIAAAAGVAGAAGAAAAAALFTDDNSPAIITPNPPEEEQPPEWGGLKARWINVDAKCGEITKYQIEITEAASETISTRRKDVYGWLTKEPLLDTTNNFYKNSRLYEAILKWLIKWDEFGGKIRTIVSVRGGQQMSGGNVAYIPVIVGKENYNKTKVILNFKSQKEPDQITRIRKTIGIKDKNDYGYFYTGFARDDTNLTRYDQGNFKDMITTLEGGGNVGIFGYGYSGSGKTYTLTNYELNDPSANGIAIQLISELKNNGYTIGLTVKELYCKDVNIVGGKINIRKKDLRAYPNDIKSLDVDTFIKEINTVKLRRIKDGHIKYTLNNPESSRGHLFYTFTLTKPDKTPGKLVICDMGGRENPIELSETSYMITEDDWIANHKNDTMRPVMDENGKQRIPFSYDYWKCPNPKCNKLNSKNLIECDSDKCHTPKPKEATKPADITCKNESYVGQIAERIDNDMLRFYVKDPNDDTKWLKNPITDNLIFQHIKMEFVEGKKDTYGNPVGKNAKRITGAFIKGSETSKCDSLLKSTFGSFFMTPSKKDGIDENDVRTRLEITKDGKKGPGVAEYESDVVTKITKSLNSFIDCCKEGIYINETINHLVAYVNFLSNVDEYLNNIEVERPIISNDHVSGLTTSQSVYHSERHIYDPRAVIKKMYGSNLDNIMKGASSITKSDDTVGIISELNQIKNPIDDKKSPSMLCFIACISSDNLQPKNKIATQNTLEFAMSVSASNGPPENVVVVPTKEKPAIKPETKSKTEEPLNNFYTRPDIIRNAATHKLDKLIKLGKSADDKIAAIIKFVRRDNDDVPSAYETTLPKEKRNRPNYRDHYDRIYKAFIAYYIAKGPTLGISNVLSSYNKSNRELVQSVIKAGGAKTRKRESRREKKNRITRRRNRV